LIIPTTLQSVLTEHKW